MNEITFFENFVNSKIKNINTAYLGKVLSVSGNTARLQPLNMHKAVGGKAKEQKTTTALIPPNIKFRAETITYMTSATTSDTKTVLIPENLAVGDIVYVGICDRDISNAQNGEIREATARHHNINDGVILQFVR
jgi:hypothetical protein